MWWSWNQCIPNEKNSPGHVVCEISTSQIVQIACLFASLCSVLDSPTKLECLLSDVHRQHIELIACISFSLLLHVMVFLVHKNSGWNSQLIILKTKKQYGLQKNIWLYCCKIWFHFLESFLLFLVPLLSDCFSFIAILWYLLIYFGTSRDKPLFYLSTIQDIYFVISFVELSQVLPLYLKFDPKWCICFCLDIFMVKSSSDWKEIKECKLIVLVVIDGRFWVPGGILNLMVLDHFLKLISFRGIYGIYCDNLTCI